MKLKILKNRSGFTLVELMITTGLFGYCALMAGTLFAEGMKLVVTARAQADFNQQLTGFNDVVDTYIANATRIRGCLCGSGTNCLYNGATGTAALPVDGTSVPTKCGAYIATGGENVCDFLDFDTETENNPGAEASGACIGSQGWDQMSGVQAVTQAAGPNRISGPPPIAWENDYQLFPKGCKERIKLRFIPPRRNAFAAGNYTIGIPGEMQMVKISTAGTESVLAKISGVYAFQCGFDGLKRGTANQGAATGFRLDIEAKTRRQPAMMGPANIMESWAPQDSTEGGLPFDLFKKGIHRTLELNIQFRNLSAESIHFGRTASFRGCKADGQTTMASDCCSGYFDRGTNRCLAKTSCVPAELNPNTPVNPLSATVDASTGMSQDWEKCCSHRAIVVKGVHQCI